MKYAGAMIGSDNPKALGEFYTKVFGKPGFQEGDWYGWVDGAQIMIGAHSAVNGKNASPERIMLVLSADDVKAAFEEIVRHGATVIAKPYRPNDENEMWLATVADPDGNYLQLSTPWE